MELYDYLLKTYGKDEPIFLDSLEYNNKSYAALRQELKKLCDSGKIKRYEQGIYYIPTYNELGESILSSSDVAYKKYIENDSEIIGYFSGLTLLNIEQLSNQVPNEIFIVTNKETNIKRTIKIGGMKYNLYKPKVKVSKENVETLKFLSLIDFIGEITDKFNNKQIKVLNEIINKNQIKKSDLIKYAPAYSNKTCRLLLESQVLNNYEQ